MINSQDPMPASCKAPLAGKFLQPKYEGTCWFSEFIILFSSAAPTRRGRGPGVEKLLAQRFGDESGNTTRKQTATEDGIIYHFLYLCWNFISHALSGTIFKLFIKTEEIQIGALPLTKIYFNLDIEPLIDFHERYCFDVVENLIMIFLHECYTNNYI